MYPSFVKSREVSIRKTFAHMCYAFSLLLKSLSLTDAHSKTGPWWVFTMEVTSSLLCQISDLVPGKRLPEQFARCDFCCLPVLGSQLCQSMLWHALQMYHA